MTKRESLCHDPLNSLTGLQVKSPNQNANEQAYKDIVPVKIDPVEIPVLENTLHFARIHKSLLAIFADGCCRSCLWLS